MKRATKIFLLILLFFAAALVVGKFLLGEKEIEVRVARAERGDVEEIVVNSRAGTVKSRRRASLSPEYGGRVVEVSVKEGDRVRAGQLLLSLDDTELRQELRLREAERERAVADRNRFQAGFEQAVRDETRTRRLVNEGVLPVERLEKAETARAEAEAALAAAERSVKKAEAALRAARIRLEKTSLRAPFDAVVAEIETERGEYISPSPPGLLIPPVIDLFDPEALYVSAPLDEADRDRVRVGLPARVTFDALQGHRFHGTVARVAPYIEDREEQNRTFEVEIEFETALPAEVTGSTADVEIIVGKSKDVLRLPASAVTEQNTVLVLENGRLVEHKVTVGKRNWEFVEVREGISEGEVVVTNLDDAEVKAGRRARAVEYEE